MFEDGDQFILNSKPVPLVCVDLETGGRNPHRNPILEIGCRVGYRRWTSEDGWVFLPRNEFTLSVRIQPEDGQEIEQEAAQVNGYTAEGWAVAKPLKDVLPQLAVLLGKGSLLGHNFLFDVLFLKEAFFRHNVPWPPSCYRFIDTMSLAHVLQSLQPAEKFPYKLSLQALTEHYGVSRAEPHRAISDVDATLAVYLKMLNDITALRLRSNVTNAVKSAQESAPPVPQVSPTNPAPVMSARMKLPPVATAPASPVPPAKKAKSKADVFDLATMQPPPPPPPPLDPSRETGTPAWLGAYFPKK